MCETAAPDSEARTVVDERLKGEVEQVHVLNLGARLDLDDVPLVLADRIQDVHAGKTAIVYKASLEQRQSRLGGLQRPLKHLLKVGHVGADLDAAGVKGFGQSANLMALIEDGLRGGVRLWDSFPVVVGDPEQLPALSTPQELRLGNVGPLRRRGGVQSDAAHDMEGMRYFWPAAVASLANSRFSYSALM